MFCACVHQDCDPQKFAASVSDMLAVQQLLEQNNLLELLQGFSFLDLGRDKEDMCDQDNNTIMEDAEKCKDKGEDYVQFFCGDTQSKFSSLVGFLLKRSSKRDSYRQGKLVLG